MKDKRVNIQFDETGAGSVLFDEAHARGVWGLSLKDIDMANGERKAHAQLMVMVEFEIEIDSEHPEAGTDQPYMYLTQIGKDWDYGQSPS